MIQHWAPSARKSGMIDAQAYTNCWKGFWAVNYKDPQVWEVVDAIVWSWKPNKEGPFSRIKIPKRHALKAKAVLARAHQPRMDQSLDME